MSKTLTQKGVNAQREILSPNTDIGQDIKDVRSSSPFPNFCRAVVVDVIFDPAMLSTSQIADMKTKVSNPELLDNIPRNSIIVRVVSNAKDRRDTKGAICYPFFPQNFALPVKPGEQVWIMFEKPDESIRQGFWLCRITEPGNVDDVNFTHPDRKYSKKAPQTTADKFKSKDAGAEIIRPEFNNGADKNTQTLQGEGDYDTITKDALASGAFTPEPVPRFVKRPGDALLQGSNNAIIVVGEDRIGSASDKPANPGGSGTVDINAGRGRFVGDENTLPIGNAPKTIKNSRGSLETDKNPKVNNGTDNVNEGNPDLLNDSSRVYVSMKTDGDSNFGTSPSAIPIPFVSFQDYKAAPYIISRSDHLRMIARKDAEHNIDGSVRILKEGGVGDDQAGLFLEPGGVVQLDGKIIYIGRVGGKGPGVQGSEPYIKFSDFKTLMTDILNDLTTFTTSLASSFASNTTPGYGAPCPQLTLAAGNECATLLASIQERIAQIDTVKSERIFGE